MPARYDSNLLNLLFRIPSIQIFRSYKCFHKTFTAYHLELLSDLNQHIVRYWDVVTLASTWANRRRGILSYNSFYYAIIIFSYKASHYILLCNQIDVVCFDKTGTLTSEAIEIMGVAGTLYLL